MKPRQTSAVRKKGALYRWQIKTSTVFLTKEKKYQSK